MNYEDKLNSLRFIRNTFDTIGVECAIASKTAIDTWAIILESKDDVYSISYTKNVLHKLKALDSLLYSINVQAEKIINDTARNEISGT